MSLLSTREAFANGQLTKADYIHHMHSTHRVLFEYASLVEDTGISKIEIADGQVVMTARDTGVRLMCDPHDERIAPIEILNFGQYEPLDSAMMAELFGAGGSLFDIGANFGWYALNFASKIKNLTVEAFEPLPQSFAYLKQNLALNPHLPVHLHAVGLSDKKADMAFYYYASGSVNASLANVSERADATKVVCPVTTLDNFVRDYDLDIDYIKCDVEGAELMVFQGASEVIAQRKPVIFTEMLRKWSAKFNYHPNAIIELLEAAGYRCFTATDEGLADFERINDTTVETNFFFLHAPKHASMIRRLQCRPQLRSR